LGGNVPGFKFRFSSMMSSYTSVLFACCKPDWNRRASATLFRSINRHGQVQSYRLAGIDVARIMKNLADRTGLDAVKYAGHSLRAGHATSAAIAGASERSIMRQTGHRSVQMVRRYIRDGSLFRENSAGKLGL
jgi:integrase